ncbi:MAG: hypothetical protein ABWY45_09555 [Mycobacterium sp.]
MSLVDDWVTNDPVVKAASRPNPDAATLLAAIKRCAELEALCRTRWRTALGELADSWCQQAISDQNRRAAENALNKRRGVIAGLR